MMKIPIITQNFSSPDVFSDTPLMLLPQAPPPSVTDRDQDGFSQLLLHDLHRHRQSYVRSFTAFETLKKRQDFVLRQENLRSLLNLEQRVHTKQEQLIDQSIHSYEQCFVKVINGNLTPHGSLQEQQKRAKTGPPSFEKLHLHQLSHMPTTSLDHPPVSPFQRYQKSHRPAKYRSHMNLNRSVQSFHDEFHSSSFSHHIQPFLTFTESYLQKYGDRSSNKYHLTIDNDEMDEIREIEEDNNGADEEQNYQQIRSASVEPHLLNNQNKKQERKSKPSDAQQTRTPVSSRNTNTPSSTPRISYYDPTRDGLTIVKDNQNPINKTSVVNEKHRSSLHSTSQISNIGSKTSTKQSKKTKKKQAAVGLTLDKKSESITIKTPDNDLLKTAMFVQNYETNSAVQDVPAKIERIQIPVNINRKIPSAVRRASVKSNDSNLVAKPTLGDIATQMTAAATTIETNNEQNLVSTTTDIKQDLIEPIINSQTRLDVLDNRKRTRKGAFDANESVSDFVAFELGLMANSRSAMKKNRFRLGKENNQNGEDTEVIPENQATLDLLEKIRQSASGLAIGKPPVSQQGCRFELPSDLKLLENLTPLEYLSKYCRLSSRRNYQFKRIFDKYRNSQYRFESNNLYLSIVDVYSESFTRSKYDDLCQLIDLGNEQHQFTFDTFAGILALCERILYESSRFRTDLEDSNLAKDTIEKCDFDSLERKFDGLKINETMKRLLQTI